MAAVTATEYKGFHIAYFKGAWRICGELRFWAFKTEKEVRDYIDAYTANEGGYI